MSISWEEWKADGRMVFREVKAEEAFLRCVPRKLPIATRCPATPGGRGEANTQDPFPVRNREVTVFLRQTLGRVILLKWSVISFGC